MESMKVKRIWYTLWAIFIALFVFPLTAFADSYSGKVSIRITSTNARAIVPDNQGVTLYNAGSSTWGGQSYIYFGTLNGSDNLPSTVSVKVVFQTPDSTITEYNLGNYFTLAYSLNGSTFTTVQSNFNPSSHGTYITAPGIYCIRVTVSSSYPIPAGCGYSFRLYLVDSSDNSETLIFPDITSAYNSGFSDGYSDGLTAGYSSGYSSGYSVGNSDGYSSGYSVGNSVGYSSGYSVGFSDGEDSGYSLGYSNGYNAGFAAGGSNGGSFSGSSWIFSPIDHFVISSTRQSQYVVDYDNIDTYYPPSVVSDYSLSNPYNLSFLNLFRSDSAVSNNGVGCVISNSGDNARTVYISDIFVPSGSKIVFSITRCYFGFYSSQVGANPVPVYKTTFGWVNSTVSRVRVWSHYSDSSYDYFDSDSTYGGGLLTTNHSSVFITDPLTVSSGIFDFEIFDTYNGSSSDFVYLISIGYLSPDYSGSVWDLLNNGNSDTPSIIDRANSRLDSFNSHAGVINSFEDSWIGSFESNIGSVNSSVSNFSFGSQFLNCRAWVSDNMQYIYNNSSDFQIFYIFPLIMGLAIIFIGGGFKHQK